MLIVPPIRLLNIERAYKAPIVISGNLSPIINGETQLDRWQFSAFLKTLGNRRNTDLEATSKVPRLNKEFYIP